MPTPNTPGLRHDAVVDFATVLADPANSTRIANYDSGDGLHPSDAGHAAWPRRCRRRCSRDIDPVGSHCARIPVGCLGQR